MHGETRSSANRVSNSVAFITRVFTLRIRILPSLTCTLPPPLLCLLRFVHRCYLLCQYNGGYLKVREGVGGLCCMGWDVSSVATHQLHRGSE